MRTKTRALSVFTGAAAGLIFLAGCSAGPAEPESQVPTAEEQEDKVRLVTMDEATQFRNNGAGPLPSGGVSAILAKGDCLLPIDLAYSAQDLGTKAEKHTGDELRDRAAVTFRGKSSWWDPCTTKISDFLTGMKVVDAAGQQVSAYRDIQIHKIDGELGSWHEGEPTLGDKGTFLAAMEIEADKFGPDMKLVLETPDGDFTVEGHDWSKLSKDYADESLVEDGACLAGEKL